MQLEHATQLEIADALNGLDKLILLTSGHQSGALRQIHTTVRKMAFELDTLRERTSVSMGVGDGSGQLFVYGIYEAIKTCQEKILK